MSKRCPMFAISVISLACATSVFAALPINLKNQPVSLLNSVAATHGSSIKQISTQVDFNQTTHKRMKQMYVGYPVWGGDAIVHVPNGAHASTMNGLVYEGLNADLANTPAYVFAPAQAEQALEQAIQLYQTKSGVHQYDRVHTKKELMVYVDKTNKAHWVFLVSFIAGSNTSALAVPTYILDATSFAVYEEWNDLQTLEDTQGGGFGGNVKMGKLVYDGLKDDYPKLGMERDIKKSLCYLENKGVKVKNDNLSPGPFSDSPVATFACKVGDNQHDNIYWDATLEGVNGGYSPANDALYVGQVIIEMYKKWYNLPVLSQFGQPMMLNMHVHAKDFSGKDMDNAFFLSFNSEMYFGDGVTMFYPLTSLGVGAHELSHGFTAQHSNLTYEKQSGGLNESFSDMAAQAAEFYSMGHNSWQIGPEIVKGDGALRYMDEPTKDGRSISNMKDYTDSINVHLSSGIFNKVFYLIGTAKDWDTQKAFNVMVQANMNYWTANTTFADAACGVLKATADRQYDKSAVIQAFDTVGIDTKQC